MNDDFDADGARSRPAGGGYVEYSFAPRAAHRRVPNSTLCAAAEKWLSLERPPFPRGHARPRSLARPSLTRFDLCKLVTVADIGALPGLDTLSLSNPEFDVEVVPETSPAPRSLCTLATNVTIAMLDAAGLK